MEVLVKTPHRHLMLATALAAGLAFAVPLASGPSLGEESATVPTNPGFNPGTGQINPGTEHPAPSSSTDIRKIPSPAEARAAMFAPNDPNPVAGQEAPLPPSNGVGDKPTESKSADPTTATGGQAAIGGSLSPGASAAGGSPGSRGAGSAETTGARPASAAKDSRPGPIGATGQTMPAKISARNDTLDRLPVMAWPMRLSDQDRQKVYQAVMADKSQPASGADKLAPASELSTDQALNGMHALPESLRGIDAVNGLMFVKAKNKVLLVTPATRTVVDEITS
jgi:hypothetical protein